MGKFRLKRYQFTNLIETFDPSDDFLDDLHDSDRVFLEGLGEPLVLAERRHVAAAKRAEEFLRLGILLEQPQKCVGHAARVARGRGLVVVALGADVTQVLTHVRVNYFPTVL